MEYQNGQATSLLKWYNPNRFNAADAALAYLVSAVVLLVLQFAVTLFLPAFSGIPYLADILFTLISQGAMLSIALSFSRVKKVDLYRGGGDYYDKKQFGFGWIFLVFLGCLFTFSPLADIFVNLLFTEEEILAVAGETEEHWTMWVLLFVTAILPAVCEEALFRGVICRGLAEYGKGCAVFFSALFFMLMHANPMQTVYQFALGIFLGILMVKTGNIYLCMMIHGVNNALSFLGSIPAIVGISSLIGILFYYIATVAVGIVLLWLSVKRMLESSRRIPFLLKEDGSVNFGLVEASAEQKKRQAGNYFYTVKEGQRDGGYVTRTQAYFNREPLQGEGDKFFYTDDYGWQRFNRTSKRWKVGLFSALAVFINVAVWIFLLVTIKSI